MIPAAGIDARVGGFTAASTDFAEYLGGRMPLLIGVVLLLSFILLMAVFRSVLVPLKAVVMNLLSIGAAYGIIVAIFQWGWAKDVFGLDRNGPIDAWIPMFLFAIVFGLSMDYEVFLLSRIKEEYDRTRNNATAVADGLAATARVITAAALIMFCVFGAFALGDDRALKLFGLGLAIAVLVDATIVRMVLVPATMELLGDRNWWIPRWLDRILPKIQVEGKHHIAPVPASELEGEGEERNPSWSSHHPRADRTHRRHGLSGRADNSARGRERQPAADQDAARGPGRSRSDTVTPYGQAVGRRRVSGEGQDDLQVPRQRLRRPRLGRPRRRPPVEGAGRRRRQRLQADLRADRARQAGRQGPAGGAEGRQRAVPRDRRGPRGRGDQLAPPRAPQAEGAGEADGVPRDHRGRHRPRRQQPARHRLRARRRRRDPPHPRPAVRLRGVARAVAAGQPGPVRGPGAEPVDPPDRASASGSGSRSSPPATGTSS